MTKDELINKLYAVRELHDQESEHWEADALLLQFINDPDIRKAYENIPKWYA